MGGGHEQESSINRQRQELTDELKLALKGVFGLCLV